MAAMMTLYIHDYRHLAALYLAVRFLNLLMASVFNFTVYLSAATLVFVFTLAFIAKFHKYKRNNTVDFTFYSQLLVDSES